MSDPKKTKPDPVPTNPPTVGGPPAAEIKPGPVAKPEKTAMKITDPEAQAISRIGSILTGLDEAGRRRVLAWANDRFQDRPKMACPGDRSGPVQHTNPAEDL